MKKLIKKVKKTLHGDFFPRVGIGDKVKSGDLLGYAMMPEVLEAFDITPGMKVLVDEGIYVSEKTPIIKRSKGMYNETIESSSDGVVRIIDKRLCIVGGEKKEKVTSELWGRVLFVGGEEYVIDAQFLELPIFISVGSAIIGNIAAAVEVGPVVTIANLPKDIEGKIVVLGGSMPFSVYKTIAARGALGVIATSLDWNDYEKIFREPLLPTGILQGFGKYVMWDWYKTLFNAINDLYAEVDFTHSQMHLPYSDIMLDTFTKDTYLFKDILWGKRVKELNSVSDGLIAVLDSKEKTPVFEDELLRVT
ncbi:MAG: hypothetical protein QY314_03140 [Candidatus Dojkabacteria bacterium]|nr:MAG: hypothetical protein QY314_03140 [Candidatus Dojkabacteria bacterium]